MSVFLLASLLSVAAEPPKAAAAPLKQPTRFCREMFKSSSRVHSVKICKTSAEWRRWQACHASVTRYCTPRRRDPLAGATLGRETAFPLNEDSRIICRTVKVTGSRLEERQACLPKREWDRMFAETSEGLRDRQGDFSTLDRNGPPR